MSSQKVFSFPQAGIIRYLIAWKCMLLKLNCSTQNSVSLSKILPTNCSKDRTGRTKCGKEKEKY